MTIRKIQKFFAGVLTVSVLTASVFGGSALASETETTSETAAEAISEAESETTESTGTRTIVDHTGAEVVLPEKIERVVISSILPLPSVYCLFRGSADDIVGRIDHDHGIFSKETAANGEKGLVILFAEDSILQFAIPV